MNRRELLRLGMGGAAALMVGGLGAASLLSGSESASLWQIDPEKCVQCGRCATDCVLRPSAVKCVHTFSMCGYCRLCFGYFHPGAPGLTEAAENQICPTGAIRRTFVEEPFFEYRIDENLCNGCGKCVKGCNAFGNGSLYLQVRHDRCVGCNECSIARRCAGNAYLRVPTDRPTIPKEGGGPPPRRES